MTSCFRHALCPACYELIEPGATLPFLLSSEAAYPEELCCRCRLYTGFAVYYRAEPDRFPCHGLHPPA